MTGMLIALALGLLLFGVWLRLPISKGKGSVLGRTDYTVEVRRLIRFHTSGSRVTVRSKTADRAAVFTKYDGDTDDGQMGVRLIGLDAHADKVERFRSQLELLAIPYTAGDDRETIFEITESVLRRGGRILDLALIATGLQLGDTYSTEFDGKMDPAAVKRYGPELVAAVRRHSSGRE